MAHRKLNLEHSKAVMRSWYAGLDAPAIEKKRAGERAWYAANAEKVQPKKRASTRKKRLTHPERERARDKKWRQEHPEECRAMQRRWGRANPETLGVYNSRRRTRVRQAQGSHTVDERAAVRETYEHTCACCGRTDAIELDHIVPLVQGGTNWAGNLQLLCESCNSSKRDYRITYYLPWNGVAPRIWEECELPLLDDCFSP
jgi:5-methylcytosine-specific restriction endonuclease McrA